MSVQVPKSLYDRIVEALPYGEERDELIALTTLSNSKGDSDASQHAEKSVTLIIPERAASHFAYALALGGTTAKMCGRQEESVQALYAASKVVGAMIPKAFSVFLHQSDVEKMMDMLVYQDGVAEVRTRWNSSEVVIKRPDKGDFSPSIRGRDGLSPERAEDVVRELNALADRCLTARVAERNRAEEEAEHDAGPR